MRRLGALVVVVVGAAVPASSAQAVTGTIAVTGTTGRDEVRIAFVNEPADGKGFAGGTALVILPALSVGSPLLNGTPICQPITDPLTTRAVGHRCVIGKDTTPDQLALNVNLSAGNDSIHLDTNHFVPTAVALFGGPGADTMTALVPAAITLRGEDGDDTLAAPIRSARSVNFDGGLGQDLVDFGVVGGVRAGGVRADLGLARASTVIPAEVDTSGTLKEPDQVRADRLGGIERIAGTASGDILTGGAGNDELIGQGGPDVLDGADGNDLLFGGPASDRLLGGNGTDLLDGGDGIDEFPMGSGNDTFQVRDGASETVSCFSADVVVNDLVDRTDNTGRCASITTAAARHRLDTILPRRALTLEGSALSAQLRCPRRKPERCVGTLRLRRGSGSGAELARVAYSLRPGRTRHFRLALTRAEAAGVRGRAVTLQASEVDSHGLARRVVVRSRVRR